MHYSMIFCSINTVYTENSKEKKYSLVITSMMHLISSSEIKDFPNIHQA